ncbi:hypothetical protein [Mycobacterium celatum]|uniref:Uncharacterized protein n=1 Tax=Mycobacterium celatum TaxID=28045 RepID=A0A1X1RKD8_MYCCE|nr:hypothetical protein [Mycobacterium celatum]ORV07929.1 hypothetical protein AWB95_21215 [Mycobacterium celatum]PIB75332.1 hypothetical protein CQY23_20240 [Mycobacterium celatum]
MTTPIGIDDDFQLINEQIRALKELGAKNELAEGESYDFSIRWGATLAGRFRRLVQYSAQGILSEADERRFQSLCDELRGLSELIGRFDLAQPCWRAADAKVPDTRGKRGLLRLLGRTN